MWELRKCLWKEWVLWSLIERQNEPVPDRRSQIKEITDDIMCNNTNRV